MGGGTSRRYTISLICIVAKKESKEVSRSRGNIVFLGFDTVKGEYELAAGQTISSDSRIVELLELLTNNQMSAQAEQVRQLCGYVGTLEQQLSSMTEEIKSVRQELVSMKEDTLSKHVKNNLQKAADILQKQCNSLEQQVKEVRAKICERAGKIVDMAKRKGQKALYKITQVTGMRKKLTAVKTRVDQALDKVESLEKAVEECRGQQGKSSQGEIPVQCMNEAEPQIEYGAELFEKYQRAGAEQMDRAAGQLAMLTEEKNR